VRTARSEFRRAQGGNISIIFALSIIPLIGLVGAAVDYSRANSVKSAMQAAIDATALMLSKEVTSLNATQISQKANAYFAAVFNRTDVSGITITHVYSSSAGSRLVVLGTGSVATTFSKLIGFKQLPVNVSSGVNWGNSRMRVALVLDNTGSMSSAGKMRALQTATKNLLGQLQSAATTNEDVYVSIIQFAKDIAVDTSSYSQAWIDWTDWEASNGNCQSSDRTESKTKSKCKSKGGKWTPGDHTKWNGCITDRGDADAPSSANYDTNVAAATPGSVASLYPAEQYDACPEAVMGLSYNWSAMKKLVDAMKPNGNTNQGIGLAWGWLSLVGGGPFTVPPMDRNNYDYSQIIIPPDRRSEHRKSVVLRSSVNRQQTRNDL
jgi:Flp pilus assembly protein TadG